MYDSVRQYQQALTGVYEDWHPPIMARLWAVLLPLGGGAAPLFVLQVVMYWGGLALLAVALVRAGRGRSGAAVLLIGAFPLFLGWQVAVLKDAQMAGAMLLAVGIVAWWRLAGRRIPLAALASVVVLLGYAVLVRSNAVFAIVPLAVMLSPWSVHWIKKAIVGVLGIVAILAATPLVNNHLLGAKHGTVTYTQPTFDLVGIAHFSGRDVPGLLPSERAMVAARHCYTPFFWDALGDEQHCGAIERRLVAVPLRTVSIDWVTAIVQHPLAYATHRIAHLNSTYRLIVPLRWPGGAPPAASEPNDLGLGGPGKAYRMVAWAGGMGAETPFGWPITWIIVAGMVLAAARGQVRTPARDFAVALIVSALTLEASFAVISIASDLRYHLWSMIASALAAVLIAGSPITRRIWWIGGAALALVLISGVVARAVLPLPPSTYQAMLG